ncbi:MAG TPA: dual specificity protein phosphatase family protein [Ktedonobacteraceae bacterium]|nr:dual specificity protein phosphatase family protein [Ktedonobacteraceae bacterium]
MSEEIVQQIKERMYSDPAFRHELIDSPLRVLQAYPLTEEEKQQFIAPNFGWMIENRLAGVSYPRSEDTIALLSKLGVQALLTLSEESLPAELLSKYQLRAEHLPVTDFTAPTLEQVKRAIDIIDDFLAQGLPVAVHCRAGLGRTGTILACYLVSQGCSAREAIEQVRMKRPGSIETAEQEAVVEKFLHICQKKKEEPSRSDELR